MKRTHLDHEGRIMHRYGTIILAPKRGLDAEHRRRQVYAYLVQCGVKQRLGQRQDTQPTADRKATVVTTGATTLEVV
jgi:hypothetical protein